MNTLHFTVSGDHVPKFWFSFWESPNSLWPPPPNFWKFLLRFFAKKNSLQILWPHYTVFKPKKSAMIFFGFEMSPPPLFGLFPKKHPNLGTRSHLSLWAVVLDTLKINLPREYSKSRYISNIFHKDIFQYSENLWKQVGWSKRPHRLWWKKSKIPPQIKAALPQAEKITL